MSSGSVYVWPVPASTCVAGNGGVRSSEFMPEGSRELQATRGGPDG